MINIKGYANPKTSGRSIDQQTGDILTNIKSYFVRNTDIPASDIKVLIDLNEAPTGIENELATQTIRQLSPTELATVQFVY